MPLRKHVPRARRLAALAVWLTAAAPAFAGGVGETVYADSFGNLVIHSPAGFKRIVVGRGHLADELAYGPPAGPKVVYLEEESDGRVYLRERKKCHYGALLHGRAHMYGLPDNVVPVPTVSCR